MRLDRYLLRAVLGSVLMVIAVFLALGALFLFIGQQDDIGVGSYGWADAAGFVLLNLPEQVWQLLPITAMIGALIGLGALMRGSELTIMRVSGLSVWRIARTVALAGGILAALGALLGEWLAPPMMQYARQQKTFSKFSEVAVSGPAGAWLRDGQRLVNVDRQSGSQRLGGILVVEISNDFRLASVARATSATASVVPANGASRSAPGTGGADPAAIWTLNQYAESRFAGANVVAANAATHALATALRPELLGAASANPAQMPARALWRVMHYLEENGLDNRAWVFAFWSRMARLAAIVFAVMLAVPFVFGSLRSAGGGSRAMVGVAVGVGFFLLQSLLENGVLVFDLNPGLLAWLPTGLLAAAALALTATTR